MPNARDVFDEEIVNKIAQRAEANPRSVWKRLAGGTVRGRVQARIDREIASARANASTATQVPTDVTITTAA
jgi:hypothetical protein